MLSFQAIHHSVQLHVELPCTALHDVAPIHFDGSVSNTACLQSLLDQLGCSTAFLHSLHTSLRLLVTILLAILLTYGTSLYHFHDEVRQSGP